VVNIKGEGTVELIFDALCDEIEDRMNKAA
jgi:hypothetical protein